ncbi:MAG: hypothetical protein M0P64_04085 [Candidatus Pacebacteria bacterium]|jgi:hypothetical protein|nr:hypothetical protein [Candidatus Paceibacterota bacterium]
MATPIISLVVIFLSLVSMFFYVIPAYDLNIARRGDIESLTKILDTSGEIKTLIDKTRENLHSIEPSVLSRFEVFLPEKIDPIRFANNIQAISLNNRIVLVDLKVDSSEDLAKGTTPDSSGAIQGLVGAISLGTKINQAATGNNDAKLPGTPDATGKRYATTKAALAFTSTYETFQLFLNDLERSLGVINVTALSFTPASAETADSKKSKVPQQTVYQFTLNLETYSLK